MVNHNNNPHIKVVITGERTQENQITHPQTVYQSIPTLLTEVISHWTADIHQSVHQRGAVICQGIVTCSMKILTFRLILVVVLNF